MIILLISFGSFVAMGLPILTAALGLATGIGLIVLTSQIIDIADFGSQLALMIGLGVGIDYALFIVTRYRENYRSNGGDVDAAVEGAMNTSGRAVLFAGATVVIALLGMFALGVNLLNGVAIAAALGVVLVLAASLTLLPALLRVLGRRIGEIRRAALQSRALDIIADARQAADEMTRIGMARPREDGGRRTFLDEAAGIHDAEAVGEIGVDAHVMRHEEDRRADLALDGAQHVEHFLLHDHVERRRRFVGNDELWPADRGERGRFSGAVRADDAHHLPFAHVERSPTQRHQVAIADRKIFDREKRRHHASMPR